MKKGSYKKLAITAGVIVVAVILVLAAVHFYTRFKVTHSPAWAAKIAAKKLQSGVAHMEAKRYDRALKDFNEAIKIDPTFFAAYNSRALYWLSRENLDEAIADLSKVMELDPENMRAYINRGVAYGRRQEWDSAIADFTRAIELEPLKAEAYGYRGAAYFQKGGEELLALSDYRKAIEIDPTSAAIYYYRRGVIYGQMGEKKRAIEDFTKTIKMAPEFGYAYQGRAVAYFDNKDYENSWNDVDSLRTLGFNINPAFLDALQKASNRKE